MSHLFLSELLRMVTLGAEHNPAHADTICTTQ
eukprot:COSAG01_NODE_39478_length_475_cov_968.784574_1_plen_31_part_01